VVPRKKGTSAIEFLKLLRRDETDNIWPPLVVDMETFSFRAFSSDEEDNCVEIRNAATCMVPNCSRASVVRDLDTVLRKCTPYWRFLMYST
jgi:hypothetical protein